MMRMVQRGYLMIRQRQKHFWLKTGLSKDGLQWMNYLESGAKGRCNTLTGKKTKEY
jgi:hypothetical protein